MMHLKYRLIILLLMVSVNGISQEQKNYRIHTIAFYNLENLFDTINDPTKYDEASPMMEIKANRSKIYKKKIRNMARVLSDIGSGVTHNSPALIGICEIENVMVIEDLVNDPILMEKDYGIVHFDGPDNRSIDVGLLYQKSLFQVVSKSTHTLKIYDSDTHERQNTRDQLLVTGTLEGETIHIIVNHWPSRRGGEAKSRPKRVSAAKLNKRLIDSLQSINPYAKIVTMGDLNDNPTNKSVKTILKAKSKKENVPFKGIYNPFIDLFKKSGLGTTAYRDSWSLFDQIMVTKPFLEKDYSSWMYYKSGIFNENYLVTNKGRYEGYPFRSFADGGFTNGFSDHFPVYMYFIKEAEDNSSKIKQ
ncbi:endonuclease/exonuclease/phosphatase family protein [Olleya namhaensis]|uniref:endonuclease/exonuclease/phosphatase family protein n=1 Tax=Olleya namhaensis TaxID=1144750 RepID=UPI00233133CD|nr:endonuclease/exonuclease/phosphatase family protein [Olleya namhaensis]